MKLRNMLGRISDQKPEEDLNIDDNDRDAILQEDQREQFDHDMSILEEGGATGNRLQKEVEKEVRTAAADSLKRLHVIQRGRCPSCGEHLRKHLFASICDSCGWHTFDVPRQGIRVHLSNNEGSIEGDCCYVVNTGAVLVLKNDVVTARVPAKAVSWVEYDWDKEEIDQRHRMLVDRMAILCAWCSQEADADEDGFHLVHVAFGAAQERYCFCSDDCYEAFRKMFPARVHRNCYERSCSGCALCLKRYGDETDGIHMLAKDYLKTEKKTKG